MSEGEVSHNVIKVLNFDGLTIEIIQKISEKSSGDDCAKTQQCVYSNRVEINRLNKLVRLEEKSAPPSIICSICLNNIQPGNELILACQDAFCRVCLIATFINDKNNVIYCPSKTNCHKAISDDEIKSVVGAETFEQILVERLEKKLNSLFKKDVDDYTSILAEFDCFETSFGIASHANERLSRDDFGLWSESDDAENDSDDHMVKFTNTATSTGENFFLNSLEEIAQAGQEGGRERDNKMAGRRSNIFIKQERNIDNRVEIGSEMGAAGLWARNIHHRSFQVKQEPVVNLRQMQQDGFKIHKLSLITNSDEFVCSICEMFVIEEQGVELKSCHHNFCRDCLLVTINRSKTAQVHCPMKIEPCEKEIRDEEVQALLSPEDYQKFMKKCLNNIASFSHQTIKKDPRATLLELQNANDFEYVENREQFQCAICLTDINPGDGLMLKNCLHEYCKACLSRTIELSEELEVPCPFVSTNGTHCEGFLQDCELRSLITTAVYSDHLGRSLARAEAIIKNSFHCKTPDCHGWAEICGAVLNFPCPLCGKNNCIKCKVIHEGKTCEQYFYETNADARKTRDDGKTEAQLKELIRLKQAMPCPGCGVIIQKTTGCNHMKCTRCKRDFQWLGLN